MAASVHVFMGGGCSLAAGLAKQTEVLILCHKIPEWMLNGPYK